MFQTLQGTLTVLFIILTLIYYFSMFICDVLLMFKPEIAMKICVFGARAERLAQSLMTSSRRTRSRTAGGDEGKKDGGIDMVVNPQSMQGGSGGSGIPLSAELIDGLDEAPSAAQWALMRGNIASVIRNAKVLSEENATLKRNLERAKDAGPDLMAAYASSSASKSRRDSRREFAQVETGSESARRAQSGDVSSRRQSTMQRSPSTRVGITADATNLLPGTSSTFSNPLAKATAPSAKRVGVVVSRKPRSGTGDGSNSPLVRAGVRSSSVANSDAGDTPEGLKPADGDVTPLMLARGLSSGAHMSEVDLASLDTTAAAAAAPQ